MNEVSLYVHIPFCARPCDFCAFYTEPLAGADIERFLDALEAELQLRTRAEPFATRTIFFGGGTPSVLRPRHFERLFVKLRSLGLLHEAVEEFTIEAMPATVSAAKARLWHEHGVNRISLGAQSFDESLLDRLGRPHNSAAIEKSFAVLREAGFGNINLDLIFAIPTQTPSQWRDTLSRALALRPEHCSTYELTYEEGSAMTAARGAGRFEPTDQETAAAMYEEGIRTLAARGYPQYEISNFARPGFRSLHNLNYWLGGDCLAVGPSAAGYWRGCRYKNLPDVVQYIDLVSGGRLPLAYVETLPPHRRAGELAAFGLRMNDGLDVVRFCAQTGFSLEEFWGREIAELCAEDLAEFDGACLRLTARGRLLADTVAERMILLPEERVDTPRGG